jgi:protoporphyrinogen oxidase
MPLKDLTTNIVGDKVPQTIKTIARNLPYRAFITVGLLVTKLNLKNETSLKTINNIIPDCWIYMQDPTIKMCRLQIFNNWSPYLVKDLKNTIWLGLEYTCNENDEYWQMSPKAFTNFAINELASTGIISKDAVIDTHVEKIKKAYPAYFDSYKDIAKLIKYLNTITNLYCIGRNGQHHYNNMDHSMETAMVAASNIKNNILTKTNIWSVNTDKIYNEEKQKIKNET